MKVRTKLTVSFLVIGVFVAVLGGISLYQLSSLSEPLSDEIPFQIAELHEKSDLDSHAQLIRYYDEVLTQSARNYAFTLDKKWEQRYLETVPLLDDAISHAIENGDETEVEFFQSVNSANLALIDLETQAINHINDNDAQQAISILQSEEYQNFKMTYEIGLRNYVESRGLEFEKALTTSSEILERTTDNTQKILSFSIQIVFLFVIIGISSSIILGFVISKSITKPIEKLSDAASQITKGTPISKIDVPSSQNEISELIKLFNTMSKAIQKNIELEKALAISHENLKKDKLETIGLMSSSLSHNLRNPLAAIKGMTDMLKLTLKDKLDESDIHRLTVIDESILNMIDQIEGVLSFVRNKPLILKSHSILKVLESTNEKLIVPSGVKIHLPDNDVKINCDSQKLEVVFSNIISNAIQSIGDEGDIKIQINTQHEQAIIEFEDSGSGVDEKIISKIFDPLFTTKSFGTGLGLAACKGIIEQHGGTISVKNNPSSFVIYLPRYLTSEQVIDKNKFLF
jgi:signal transduction histidine kinase